MKRRSAGWVWLLGVIWGGTVQALPPAPVALTVAQVQSAPAAALVPLKLELREVAGQPRVFVTLPVGTAPFSPKVTLQGREALIELPFGAVPAEGRLGPIVPAYAVAGRRLTLTLGADMARVEAQFWPAVGNWPPGLALDLKPASAVTPAVSLAPLVVTPPAAVRPATPAPPAPLPPAATMPPKRSGPVQASVVLDPGHGGIDPGMTSRWVREADVNLDVALRTARALQAHGVNVILTRRSDVHLHPDKGTDLNLRSRMAKTGQVSAFVSIHVNAATSGAAHGIETYYFGQPLPGQGRSLAVRENGGGSVGEQLTAQASRSAQGLLGDLLSQAKLSFSRRLAGLVQSELLAATGAHNRGVKTDAFYVIRSPTTPAILTELGFGSNPAEGARLATPEYRQRQADAIARALLRFLNAS